MRCSICITNTVCIMCGPTKSYVKLLYAVVVEGFVTTTVAINCQVPTHLLVGSLLQMHKVDARLRLFYTHVIQYKNLVKI